MTSLKVHVAIVYYVARTTELLLALPHESILAGKLHFLVALKLHPAGVCDGLPT